jgi:hypothetical protein
MSALHTLTEQALKNIPERCRRDASADPGDVPAGRRARSSRTGDVAGRAAGRRRRRDPVGQPAQRLAERESQPGRAAAADGGLLSWSRREGFLRPIGDDALGR